MVCKRHEKSPRTFPCSIIMCYERDILSVPFWAWVHYSVREPSPFICSFKKVVSFSRKEVYPKLYSV